MNLLLFIILSLHGIGLKDRNVASRDIMVISESFFILAFIHAVQQVCKCTNGLSHSEEF